jgi:serine phosphatase RsbU (regulator of sigma subunit)
VTTQHGGFITCLCLHVTADGHATVANAGHLSPYRNGVEIPVETGIPLGVMCEVEYQQSTFVLKSGEQLTLLTDGVLEARNHATGELFGFERTTTISSRSAEAIAQAAQVFGQEDDITVLTLIFAPTRDTVATLPQLQTVDGSQ